MKKELYTQKIEQLTDDKLKQLLSLRTAENSEIIDIASKEAIKRGIDPETIEAKSKSPQTNSKKEKKNIWTYILLGILPGPTDNL
jgi:uncharacterized protein YajQ (UPF0234 family)